ncbi:MAG: HNH endonuclease [Acidithiobacillales bacterium SG8_45]|jgi:5-methylcytosine-specific restriction endonuclease McrA|nr:MAG: HNH endonuclease [Acidithiobacillales bacterium SG8_45]
MAKLDDNKLNRLVADSRRAAEKREQDYREQALKMYPHICGRCGREFNRDNLQELTVHHRDHNHDNNPADGSNWELLCIYCHDNEHQRQLEAEQAGATSGSRDSRNSTYNPFADLKSLLDQKK